MLDRVMSMKLAIGGMMRNAVCGYAQKIGYFVEQKDKFWSKLGEGAEIPTREERVLIGADFNEHVDEGNRGDEEVMKR